MRLGPRILRFMSSENEDQRMELRKAIACSQAHSENITRTLEDDGVKETIRNLFKSCSCGDD